MSVEENKEGLLQDFQWEGSSDFFGVPGTAVEPVKAEEKEEVKNEEVKVEEPEEKEEVKEEVSFFEQSPEEKVENDTSEDAEFYSSLYSNMKEKGILSMDLEEDEEVNEEKFFELQDQEIEARVEETIEGFMEELDSDAKAFLRFKREGGNTNDFFKVYKQAASTPDVDIEEDKGQNSLLRHYYSTVEGMPEDEIEDKLEWLSENGKKSAYAERYKKKLDAMDTQMKQQVQKTAAKQRQAANEQKKLFENNIRETLDNTESIGDFTFSKKDKTELNSYITKAAVKIGKNQFITQLQADMQKTFSDPQKLLLLAKLLKSDFDVSDIKAKTETKVVQNTKNDLRRAKKTSKLSSGRSGKGKGLSDYF